MRKIFLQVTSLGIGSLLVAGYSILFAPRVLAQSEYYFPQQQRTIKMEKRVEFGIRTRLRTSGGAQRFFEVIPSLTYSPAIFPRLQINTELPLTHGEISTGDPIIGSQTETDIGDLTVSLRYTLMGEANWQLIGSFESTFATGKNPIENPIGTGGGFDRYTPGLTYIYLKDPISTFFHVGYEFSQDEMFNIPQSLSGQPQTLRDLLRIILLGPQTNLPAGPTNIDPGDAIRIRGGTSVLFNPTTRFNLFTSVSIRGEQEIDGRSDPTSRRDDVRLGAGMDFDLSPTTQLSMNFVFGINQASEDLTWVTGYTYQF